MLATVRSVSLTGLDGHELQVETDISNGLFRFVMIGLPDTSLGEAKERVRSALENGQFPFPLTRVTVNLSPAELPKHGAGHDLAIAMSMLVAQGVVQQEAVEGAVFLGELALGGQVRPIRGVLPAVRAAAAFGARPIVVPRANLEEASLVPDARVVGVGSLLEAAERFGAELTEEQRDLAVQGASAQVEEDAEVAREDRDGPGAGDLSDVIGQEEAVQAMLIAAVGGHHCFLLGPPGAGKTLLASRLPTILPDLSPEQAIEVTSLRSLTSVPGRVELASRPPWQAPHHTATSASIVGGGSGLIRPGAVSLATHGVLFLDEVLEFPRHVLDALRQSLESGQITLHRSRQVARFPARFQLVMAANPCPCGYDGVVGARCTCEPMAKRRYRARLSGPMLDRVDLHLRVRKVHRFTGDGARAAMTSEHARGLVTEARERSRSRLAGSGWARNAEVPGRVMRGWLRGAEDVLGPLDRALQRGALTMRGVDRVLRVAWSIADLEGHDRPLPSDVGLALSYRQVSDA